MKKDIGTFSFSSWLDPQFNLVWIGGKTNGRLHYDRNENLMGMILGEKIFTIFDPYQSDSLHAGGKDMKWTANIKYYFNSTHGVFWRNPEDLVSISEDPTMSPINLKAPDFKRYPKFKNAKPLVCKIKPGDVLFVPSNWWHEVESKPDPVEGLTIGTNIFYQPYFHHWGVSHPLEYNEHYLHIRNGVSLTRPTPSSKEDL